MSRFIRCAIMLVVVAFQPQFMEATPVDIDGDGIVGPQEAIDLSRHWKGPTLPLGEVQPWQSNGTSIFYNAGSVGIGTATPEGPFDVRSANNSYFRLDSTNGDIHFNGGDDGVFGFYNDSGPNGRTEIIAQGIPRLVVDNFGFVGIGTTAPIAQLEVRGNIRLGNSGQYLAPAGEENLRIIRGVVSAAGNIIVGTGFTVAHPEEGYYTITFTTPFSGPPTITATVQKEQFLFAVTDGVLSTHANLQLVVPTTGIAARAGDAPFHFIAIGPR